MDHEALKEGKERVDQFLIHPLQNMGIAKPASASGGRMVQGVDEMLDDVRTKLA